MVVEATRRITIVGARLLLYDFVRLYSGGVFQENFCFDFAWLLAACGGSLRYL